jgi:hypothetical protein
MSLSDIAVAQGQLDSAKKNMSPKKRRPGPVASVSVSPEPEKQQEQPKLSEKSPVSSQEEVLTQRRKRSTKRVAEDSSGERNKYQPN